MSKEQKNFLKNLSVNEIQLLSIKEKIEIAKQIKEEKGFITYFDIIEDLGISPQKDEYFEFIEALEEEGIEIVFEKKVKDKVEVLDEVEEEEEDYFSEREEKDNRDVVRDYMNEIIPIKLLNKKDEAEIASNIELLQKEVIEKIICCPTTIEQIYSFFDKLFILIFLYLFFYVYSSFQTVNQIF